jgi:hypothetical protein
MNSGILSMTRGLPTSRPMSGAIPNLMHQAVKAQAAQQVVNFHVH